MSDSRWRVGAAFLLAAWMTAVIWASFFYVAPALGFRGYHSSRILFYHVPTAWVATLAFLVSCVASIMYLKRRSPEDDARAASSAALGLTFAILATVTGSLFAKIEWRQFWNWDPRQTSIAILLLIYAAYFALRAAVPDPERRATLAAAYAILAFVAVPFLVFVVPRIYFSLHPDVMPGPRRSGGLDSHHAQVLVASVIAFTGVFIWLYNIEIRLERLRRSRQEEML
jgi:heme exporter protein C